MTGKNPVQAGCLPCGRRSTNLAPGTLFDWLCPKVFWGEHSCLFLYDKIDIAPTAP